MLARRWSSGLSLPPHLDCTDTQLDELMREVEREKERQDRLPSNSQSEMHVVPTYPQEVSPTSADQAVAQVASAVAQRWSGEREGQTRRDLLGTTPPPPDSSHPEFGRLHRASQGPLARFDREQAEQRMRTLARPRERDLTLEEIEEHNPTLSMITADSARLDSPLAKKQGEAKAFLEEHGRTLALLRGETEALAQVIDLKLGERQEEDKTMMKDEVKFLEESQQTITQRRQAVLHHQNPDIQAEYQGLKATERKASRSLQHARQRQAAYEAYEKRGKRIAEIGQGHPHWYLRPGKLLSCGWHKTMQQSNRYQAWEANKMIEWEHKHADQPLRRWAKQTALKGPVRLAQGAGLVVAGGILTLVFAGWFFKEAWKRRNNNWLLNTLEVFGGVQEKK